MKNKFYFEYSDSEMCYDKSYFDDKMKSGDKTEIEVFKAIPEIPGDGIFWCKEHSFCGDDTSDCCGKKNCEDYSPRNKISGVCKHHTHWLYTHGKKVTLKLS